MKCTYTLIKRDGSRKEVPFLVVEGKEYIALHISRAEFAQHDTGEVVIFEPLIDLFEAVRDAVGTPIRINSGYRSDAYQKQLYQADLKANGGRPSGKVAKPGNSPHASGAAMDLAIPEGYTAVKLATLVQQTSQALGLGVARTGYREYDGRFVHVDLVYLLFEPYLKGYPNPLLVAWKLGITW